MDGKEFFLSWAPPASPWSRWAKPVLFAQMTPAFLSSFQSPPPAPVASQAVDLSGVPEPIDLEKAALVVNLPGAAAVEIGLELARRGYQPVPLFNTCNGPMPVLPLNALISSLIAGADTLSGLHVPPDAPPAFLLDSDRVNGVNRPVPGMFDNRWVVFPQDFPSGTFLRSQGITRSLLIQRDLKMDDDLAHVLVAWQSSGVAIVGKSSLVADPPVPLKVERPSAIGLWYRALLLLTFQGRRSNAGGFGAVIPTPSSGGG